jgi:hypothetical protein
VIDSADPSALAHWWAGALGWRFIDDGNGEYDVVPPPGEPGLDLVFVSVDDERVMKNRVHLDLRSGDLEAQVTIVERLLRTGARRIDIGQGEVPWVVLADPEGNECCVVEPREEYAETGSLAAVVVEALDPAKLAQFWIEASGWQLREDPADHDLVAPDGRGPWLEFVPSHEPHSVKNRLHLDVAPYPGDDQASEVARLITLGAARVEVGQSDASPGSVTWVVLSDPEENEFCVLSPR